MAALGKVGVAVDTEAGNKSASLSSSHYVALLGYRRRRRYSQVMGLSPSGAGVTSARESSGHRARSVGTVFEHDA